MLGHGYWKNRPRAWPVQTLVLGTASKPAHNYSQTELLQLLGLSSKGDGSLILAHQLIAAKLNVANGSNPQPIAGNLSRADALLATFNGKLPYRVSPNAHPGSDMVAEASVLDDYNNGRMADSCGAPGNTAPAANAGPDQSLFVGEIAHLNGGASSDPDGDVLTFNWSLTSVPGGSAASLSNPTAVAPTFVVDRPGNYVARLIVSDGVLSSLADTVTVSTVNSPPVANAGPDRTASVGSTVTLNGGASSDVDGDPLTFAWSFLSKPVASQTSLSSATAVNPTFAIDAPGQYVAQLIVNDGHVNSVADTIVVTTSNSPPVANAGPDRTVPVGSIQLDGSGSTDIDGDPLTFAWSLTTRPAGSLASLSNAVAVKPTFVADVAGDYIAQLVVNDGHVDSAADTVMLTTQTQNRPPTANPGGNRTVPLGAMVQLDGTTSSDPDNDPLTFKWSLMSAPANSAAALSNANVSMPTFVADKAGAYVAQLIVNDGTVDSAPRTVTISTENSMPAANAGPDQTVLTGVTVHLDGSGSADPDGTSVLFAWSLLSKPAGSTATISSTTIVNPTFVADLDGTYVAQLVVGDGTLVSAPDTVTVTARQPADLGISFFNPSTNPAIGESVPLFIEVVNHGPGAVTGVTALFQLPAGYAFISIGPQVGSYDSTTGVWTIGSMPFNGLARLIGSATVKATGPYDLTASITGSSAPDPNPSDNSVTVPVVVDGNADVRIQFTTVPTGTIAPGTLPLVILQVKNLGPSSTTGVTVSFPIPAGYTLTNGNLFVNGTYDNSTGVWSIGSMPVNGGANWVGSPTVNATGSTALAASITGSSQPDPDVTNNTAAAAAINRQPIANAGADQAVVAPSTVTLDGTQSLDPEGDPISFQWAFTLRPINSAATFANVGTATPSFVPDQAGTYVARLTVTDSHGIVSGPDSVTVSATVTNQPPLIVSAPVTAADEGQPYEYDVRATDPNIGDVLIFALTAAPQGMTIDSSTGDIHWTPAAGQGGPQAVSVRVQDQGGLAAVQTFAVQVSSSTNHAPVAADDARSVRVSETLAVGAPGVLGNDHDSDGHPLAARIVTSPRNGDVVLSSDGAFTYTPHTLDVNEFVVAENVNLATSVPGASVSVSSGCGSCGIDQNPGTTWFGGFGDSQPFLEVVFPQDVTVSRVQILGVREVGRENQRVSAGILQLRAADGTERYNSGNVELPAPNRDGTFVLPDVAGVRRVRFSSTAGVSGIFSSGFADMTVIGSAVFRRQRVPEPNLVQLLPTAVQASSTHTFSIPESVQDDAPRTNWYAASVSPGEFIELTFPLGVTVTQIETLNPAGGPDGFNTSLELLCTGVFALLDGAGTVLFDSGVVNTPRGAPFSQPFSVAVPNVVGVRRARYTSVDCSGSSFQPGFGEFRVFGAAPIDAPAFSMAKKFQALGGREVHSTPIVVNLTDDNFDGRIDTRDIPDVVVPVENTTNQLKGEIKVVSGDDGRLLFTAGGPDLVSPWSEVAVGDLDGDGIPEIVAVHSDGNHLIAFDHTGATKWVSDANQMPRFDLGSAIIVGGAVSIANLDRAGPPEIIVGASVFDAAGHLIGDGRTLGGTTAGAGLRSAISAVGDIDLDGVPEIVAGPTAYRLVNGQLTKAWQRNDRADGYVAIANLDDDPTAEIVLVANGFVYVLNHDGSDAEVWNAPTHAPVAIPAGGQGGAPLVVDVDGDGRPEIGVAGASRYVLFNRDGSVRWNASISDRSSNSTGATAFDLDGDGQVEIIYRDENFLRVFRGVDGVLLARTPVGSSTWAEQPVVVDVDNDGHADIVVSSDFSQQIGGTADTGVIVLQDVANKWTRTRRIWNEHSYHVTNVNEDGTIPPIETPHWLVPGLNSFRVNLFVPGETPEGADSFTYVATDGALDSNVATVRIAVRTPNGPPGITSLPIEHAANGVPYVYAAQAGDPDFGDILTFSLPTAPNGMTIDPTSGLIQWTPTAGQLGTHDVVVKVRDVHGLFAVQGYSIDVASPIVVPNVVGQPQAAAENAITSADLVVGAISTRNSPTVPSGSVLNQTPVGGTLAAPAAPVNLVVSSGPAPVGTVPDVVGQPQGSAQADINAAGFNVGGVAGLHDATVPAGIVLSQTPAGGSQATPGSLVSLLVSLGLPPGDVDADGDGFTGTHGDCNDTNPGIHPGAFDIPGDGIDQDCNGHDAIAGDTTLPTATLISPVEDSVVTMPTDIVGTATDANFLRYTLQLAAGDSTQQAVLGSGTSPVINGVLGRIDPTRLENGIYRLVLTAEDANGQVTTIEQGVRVEGLTKVGNVRLSFTDLSVPLSGIPIAIIRTYDSRVKTSEDFGFGWTLDVGRGSYQHNRTPGEAWQIVSGGFGFPCQLISEPATHLTEIRLSDFETYTFATTLSNPRALTGGCEATAGFRFVEGRRPGATLEILDGTDVLHQNGDTNVVYPSTFTVFNPSRVRLTTADGRSIVLERGAGITHIEDLNGNSIAITPAGIIHSSGKSIAFVRDGHNRITRITDPQGHTLSYAYDAAGDLVEFLDQADNRTTFAYDSRHNLKGIVDPLNRQPLRAEYDADGRLIALTDAAGNRITMAHDLNARQEVITDRLGHATVVDYDDRGNVVRRVDPLGHTKSMTYDSHDNMLTETDGLGKTRLYSYDASNNLATEADALGHTITHTHNARNQETSRVDPLGGTVTRIFDRTGNLQSETDPLGNTTLFAYDRHGNQSETNDPLGKHWSYSYSGFDTPNQIVDPLGNVTNRDFDANGRILIETTSGVVNGAQQIVTKTHEYDALGRRTRETDAEGGVERWAYNADGKLETHTDPRGGVARYTYDDLARLITTSYPDGATSDIGYDAEGRVIARTDRAGNTIAFAYDVAGRHVSTTYPDGTTTRENYDAAGRATSHVDAAGGAVNYAYDAAGHQISTRDQLGGTSTFGYDAAGRRVSATDRNGHTVTFSYDHAGRLIRTDFPDGTFTLASYDAVGRRVAQTDQAGNVMNFAYDDRRDLIAVTDALGGQTRYSYDALGLRITQTDPLGNTTRFGYDRAGRMIGKILPLGQRETRTYDSAGNLAALTDFNGATTTFTYDAMNRLVQRHLPNGEAHTFTYTPTGKLASMADAHGTTTFGYDAQERPALVRYPDSAELRYAYDANGNRARLSTPSGATAYTYDAANRLTSVEDRTGNRTTLAYDAEGNRTGVTYPNGVTAAYTYDDLNRLTDLAQTRNGTTLRSYAYTLGPTGNRTRVLENTGRQVDYSYDLLFRLTAEQITPSGGGQPTSTTYVYDAFGNRLTKADNAGLTTYAYDANSRLVQAGAAALSYDANGNLLAQSTSSNGITYQYDTLNRLVGSVAASNVISAFTYDPLGNRVRSVAGGTTTNFLVDLFGHGGVSLPFDRVSCCTDIAVPVRLPPGVRRAAAIGLPQVLQESDGSGATTAEYVYGSDMLISQRRAGGVSFYLPDGLRSTRALVDAAGGITNTYDFDAFGQTLSQTGSTPNVHLYRGEQFDPVLGFYNLRARYYDPRAGRFAARDPLSGQIDRPASLHSYVYAANDPINRLDPTGREDLIDTSLAVAVAGDLDAIAVAAEGFAVTATSAAEGVSATAELATLATEEAAALTTETAVGEGAEFAHYVVRSGNVIQNIVRNLGGWYTRGANQSVQAIRTLLQSASQSPGYRLALCAIAEVGFFGSGAGEIAAALLPAGIITFGPDLAAAISAEISALSLPCPR